MSGVIKKVKGPRARAWCGTINEITSSTQDKLCQLEALAENWVTFVYQYEIGNETNRLHVQLYIEFKQAKSRVQVQDLIGCGEIHIKPRISTREECVAYCSKEETCDKTWVRFKGGKLTNEKGKRNDLEAIWDQIKEGKTTKQIMMADGPAWMKNFKAIDAAIRLLNKPTGDRVPPQVYYIWGKPGIGKTWFCHSHSPNLYTITIPEHGKAWFDGYDGVSDVLIDEFNSPWIGSARMCQLIDRYPLQVEVKGSFIDFRPAKIYICSNRSLEEIYGCDPIHYEAIKRRITTNNHMVEPWRPHDWKASFKRARESLSGGDDGCEVLPVEKRQRIIDLPTEI